MKRRNLKIVLIAACVLTFSGALVACRQALKTREDLDAEGFTCDVVFDLMGGTSGDRNDSERLRTELRQYVKSGSLIVKPGDYDTDKNKYSGAEPRKDGYTFGGYYRGTKDEEGNVTFGEKWDFATDKVTEDITLYVYWRPDYTIAVHYGFGETEEGFTKEIAVEQDEDGAAKRVSTPAITDYTVIGFYRDKQSALAHAADEAQKVKFPYAPAELTEDAPRWEIWADALEGDWVVISTANDFMFYAGDDVYLMNDIDFEGEDITQQLPSDGSYNGEFRGNGHTLSNFTISRKSVQQQDDFLGIFKRLGSNAEIRDVTFSGFTLKLETTNEKRGYAIGALAGFASPGAKLYNVKLSGTVECTLVVQTGKETVVKNLIGQRGFPEEGEEAVVTDGCEANVAFTGATPSGD